MQAIVERLVSRGASASIGLIVAIFVNPDEAGIFAMASLVLTFCQAIGEQSIRQVGTRVIRHEGGAAYIQRFAVIVGCGTFLLVVGFIVLAWGLQMTTSDVLWKLLPLTLVPIATMWSVPKIVSAQAQGEWHRISRAQWLASACSVVVAVPMAPFAGIAAAAAQSAVAEVVFAASLPRAAPGGGTLPAVALTSRFVVPTGSSGALGWMQGQADRLVVSVVAGAGVLGVVSLAASVARVPADAALTGYVNLIRADLARLDTVREKRRVVARHISRVLLVAGLLQILTISLTVLFLPGLLGRDWADAVQLVPLLTASIVPSAAVWALSAVLIDAGRAASLLPWQLAGIAVSASSGYAFTMSYFLGALLGWGRDMLALCARAMLAREFLGPRSVLLVILSVCGGAAVAAAGYFLTIAVI